jgi:hypothetical protein
MAFGELHPHVLGRIVLRPVAHGNYWMKFSSRSPFVLTLAVFAWYMFTVVDEDEVGDERENVE